MAMDSLKELYQVVKDRKSNPQENSYTCYLFEKGIDKILKKIGEESSEVIIAAKNNISSDTENEICDLLYHLTVLMVEQDIPISAIEQILKERSQKIGNLKTFHQSDKES